MTPDVADARKRLVRLLRIAHAGEHAAALAYQGHAASVRDAEERATIQRIEQEEWEHRAHVARMLDDLGERPSRFLEALHVVIGHTASTLCHVTGWFAPMYGAGLLERQNVHEYDTAARHAADAGLPDLVPLLLAMTATEREHEAWFRARAESHWLARVVPIWRSPSPAADGPPGVDHALATHDVDTIEESSGEAGVVGDDAKA